MVHRRFPVGPLGEMPYFKKVVLAHQLHHSEKYGGVPFGLFFGPQVRGRRCNPTSSAGSQCCMLCLLVCWDLDCNIRGAWGAYACNCPSSACVKGDEGCLPMDYL